MTPCVWPSFKSVCKKCPNIHQYHARTAIFWKKQEKRLVGLIFFLTFASAFRKRVLWGQRTKGLEVWVSGWNQQFAKLPCAITRTGGSNPPASATVDNQRWSVHLTVRIQDSQSWHKGSIPLPTTSYILIDLVLHQTCGQGFLVSRNLMVDSSNG